MGDVLNNLRTITWKEHKVKQKGEVEDIAS